MLTNVLPQVPPETARAARAMFSERSFYLMVGNALCSLVGEFDTQPCGAENSPAIQSAQLLALITIFQFLEHLTDRQAGEALRSRLDWKYALHLPVTFPGVPHLQTCEFRQRLLSQAQEMEAFQTIVNRMQKNGIIGARSTLQTDELQKGYPLISTPARQIVQTVCIQNRLHLLVDAMTAVIEYLAAYHTAWLRKNIQAHWYQRYSRDSAIRSLPASPEDWPAHFEAIGKDGEALLRSITGSPIPDTCTVSSGGLAVVSALQSELDRQFDCDNPIYRYRTPNCRDCTLSR